MHFEASHGSAPTINSDALVAPTATEFQKAIEPVEVKFDKDDEDSLRDSSSSLDSSKSASRRLPGFNLYNLVKLLAKEPSQSAAYERLSRALAVSAERLNIKNAKGSTALHACAYLKRWDLAQLLIDAGADPLVKNAAGHTFFLTAVKDAGAPWEALFAQHAELLEKHRKFLASGARSGGRERRLARDVPKAESVQPIQMLMPVLSTQEFSAARCAFEAGLWEDSAALAGAAVSALLCEVSKKALTKMAQEAPRAFTLSAVSNGCKFDKDVAAIFCNRAVQEGWWSDAAVWGPIGKGLGQSVQRGWLDMALKARENMAIVELVRAGWLCDDDFVERCEEFGQYDLADELIDLRSVLKQVGSAPKSGSDSRGDSSEKLQTGSRTGVVAKVARTKRSLKSKTGGKARSGRGGGGSRRASASMIANLDRPMKEANDFEYQERKPLAKAPLIIVKKARVVTPQPLTLND